MESQNYELLARMQLYETVKLINTSFYSTVDRIKTMRCYYQKASFGPTKYKFSFTAFKITVKGIRGDEKSGNRG